jgi:hypothetical protein
MEVTIVETTVAEINGIRVGAANIWDDDYTTDDGQNLHGPTAHLAVMGDTPDTDFSLKAYVGKVITFGDELWRVTEIHEPPNTRGSITLVRVGTK